MPPYPMPDGVDAIPPDRLDLRPDADVDGGLLSPPPVADDKNIWFFWHSGFANMHPYAQRTVRAWHRRFSRQGWVVRVISREPASPLNIDRFLDVDNPEMFPRAFADGTIGGPYAAQHTSDLVRWPLLLRYGGVYADVGLLQVGDLDALWTATVGDAASPYEVLSYHAGHVGDGITNYFLAARRDNPLFRSCHRLLLALWAADGGRSSTDGMYASPLLRGLPLTGADAGFSFAEDGRTFGPDEVSRLLTDYIIQGQATAMVMGLVDDADGWHGPRYVAEHVYALDFMEGSQLINGLTAWDGRRQFALLSLPLPRAGEPESDAQREARALVEACLSRSFAVKLAHGLIVRVLGETLGSLWRQNDGADDVPGTYAHWLRHGTIYWCPRELPRRHEFKEIAPFKRGPLLSEGEPGPGAAAAEVDDVA